MINEEKAREIVGFVLNPKCANGSNGLGLLNTHNQRNADLNNINKCCEEVALQAMEWKDKQLEKAIATEKFAVQIFDGRWISVVSVQRLQQTLKEL